MAKKESYHHIWWQLLVFIGVSALALFASSGFQDQVTSWIPETQAKPSTFNTKPSGYSGLLELAKKVGLSTRIFQAPYRRLHEAKGALIIVAPSATMADFEADQILKWVAKGNMLVYFDSFSFQPERKTSALNLAVPEPLLDKLKIKPVSGSDLENAGVVPKASRLEFRHVKKLSLTTGIRLKGGSTLLSDKSGSIISEVKHGQGKVIIGTAPNICANHRFASREDWGNFQFMINLFKSSGKEIWFDEACHGYSDASGLFVYLGRTALGPIFLQGVFMLLLAIVSSSQRFGRPKELPAVRRTSNLEFIYGLAGAYQRAHANSAALEIIFHAFKSKLVRALSLSPHESSSTISQAWSAETALSAAELKTWIDDCQQALEMERMPDDKLKEFVSSCDKITKQSAQLMASVSKGRLV